MCITCNFGLCHWADADVDPVRGIDCEPDRRVQNPSQERTAVSTTAAVCIKQRPFET
jgi:hypothetical protein